MCVLCLNRKNGLTRLCENLSWPSFLQWNISEMYKATSFWKKINRFFPFCLCDLTIRSVMCNCDYKPLSLFTSPCEIDSYQSLPHPIIPASCSRYRLMDCESLCYYSKMLPRMCGSKHTTKPGRLDLPLKSDFNLVWPRFRWCVLPCWADDVGTTSVSRWVLKSDLSGCSRLNPA